MQLGPYSSRTGASETVVELTEILHPPLSFASSFSPR